MTRTHTYAILEVSDTTFDEVKGKLVAAGYIRSNETTIDMSGIALERKASEVIETTEVAPGRYEPVVMATADGAAQDRGMDILAAHYDRRG